MTQAALLANALQALERTQWLGPDEIAAMQQRKLAFLARHCETYSAQFRARLQAAGLTARDLVAPGGLAKLPVLTRRDLQRATDLFCTAVPQAHMPTYETRTSGSTGEPVLVRRTALSQLHWLATTMRDHLWRRRDFAGRFCGIRANIDRPVVLPDWGEPASLLYRTGAALGLPITMDIAAQIALIREFQPNTLLIYPSNLVGLMELCENSGIDIPSLRDILTIAETLSPENRARAASVFNVSVTDMYSSQEAGNIAIQCPETNLYHVMAESLIVEVLDAQDKPTSEGEAGRIIITDLDNFATPLIRYDIGDYGVAGPACACRRGLPTLKRILGRERNLILMPDGARHWPLVGIHKFRDIAPISQFQFIQRDREQIEFRLVVERPLTAGEEQNLLSHVQQSLGYPFAISLAYFSRRIPLGASGKFEEFVCEAK